ncbi:TetR/AcrR family transcriptional regulator [Nocardioides sp. BP30]|uniref:TetR/AcrR family transcriptional regulator n=1 Tax=Nocardioides sp. BP30 TaxID=3036374 RepID=UPI002469921A|nr:TetR/AcrR family transcriptional regulator [Nocardioides sp. BP30]WGL54117.1 TetR/AcrR family transcriptional regulator [Nocardioides sp. BP30]
MSQRAMTGNSDPRAVRSRQALREAFLRAVQSQSPSEMTVAALARAAGISRTSFYEHFGSPEELAVDTLDELFTTISDIDITLRRAGSTTSPLEASRLAVQALVDFLGPRRTTYARLLGPGAAPTVYVAVSEAFVRHATDALSRTAYRPDGVDVALTARFLAGGVLKVLGIWLAEPAPRPSEEVVDALIACFPAWLTRT